MSVPGNSFCAVVRARFLPRFPLFPIDERLFNNLLSWFYKSISDIFKGVIGGLRSGLIFVSESLSLTQERIFLALIKGVSVSYSDIFSKRALPRQLNPSFCRASESVQFLDKVLVK
jgi:hypothetical protein